MSRLQAVLVPDLLHGVTPEELSSRSGLPQERLQLLLDRAATPSMYEVGQIAEALSLNPLYVLHQSPAVVARRAGVSEDTNLEEFLHRLGLHLLAYRTELDQPPVEMLPSSSAKGARATGEGWALRSQVSWDPDDPDQLIHLIEGEHRIPVIVWPIEGASFGGTLRFGDFFTIWVNSSNVPGSQQRFTLAHELGHIMLRHATTTRLEHADTNHRQLAPVTQPERTKESHAEAFAGGTLYNHERVHEVWDGELSAPSIARLAAGLGISFAAARVALDRSVREITRAQIYAAVRQWSVHDAFQAGGVSDTWDLFESHRNRIRLPEHIPHHSVLQASLVAALGG